MCKCAKPSTATSLACQHDPHDPHDSTHRPHATRRQYYSALHSTTPVLLQYYKLLLQYYSVLQSTTPVLLCTTKYYSSTTLYYKVLLQYYSVLQSTTPCTTKCAFARRGATGVTLQPHQILRLPRKMTLMIDPSHI